jgi:hypothetical protein
MTAAVIEAKLSSASTISAAGIVTETGSGANDASDRMSA